MTEAIATPAACKRRRTVVVLGAGIAGLTAAQELAERGFDVTVYEPRTDERHGVSGEPASIYPPVKLGGLAASQYSTVGPYTGSLAQLRPFPTRRGNPRDPGRAVAGEHGFRFFPAYYIHIWDLFQRIPVYERTDLGHGEIRWLPTSRTIMDNVRRVVTQGTTVEGKPSLVFPREAPRSAAEFLTTAAQLTQLGFTPLDVQTFVSRLVDYLVTSPRRREAELQNRSAYDFFVGRTGPDDPPRFAYSPRFDAVLLEMPRVLAAFDTRWGDARTNVSTYLQLQLQMDRRDNKADGVLNGPTTESWFDHWYRHLLALGVRFVHGEAASLDPPAFDPQQPPHLRPRARVTFADGTRLAPDYTVVAVDAPAAERITAQLRKVVATGGTVTQLDGFSTAVPPPDGPLQPKASRPLERRDPYAMDAMGLKPWDRFQTLGGIQYYFDTEFQLLRGHMYYSGTEWALSSINQHGLWEKKPILNRDGFVSVLSVDIGDFNTSSRHLKDSAGKGKAARDCTADEIATEVWRQIVTALTSSSANVAESLLPWPAWYAIDRGLIMEGGPGQGVGRPVRNETPYLVPIVGDWPNRPGADPWNPTGNSWAVVPSDEAWQADLEERNVWQARHGGFQVHNNSVVFAGTWTKTFTRMTSMEAACESGRHAVNAILDHYIWVESGGADRRGETSLDWRSPYGFIDQGLTTPVRMPSPAGDYCYVVDLDNREPLDTRTLRNFNAQYGDDLSPPRSNAPAGTAAGILTPPVTPFTGGQPMTSPIDYNQYLLAYVQAWRQLLDASAAMTSGLPMPPGAGGMPPTPPMPMTPPLPPGSGAARANPPADYAQQLFSYLQAWRQYLEHAISSAGSNLQPLQPPTSGSTGSQSFAAQPSYSGPWDPPPPGSPPSGPPPPGSPPSDSGPQSSSSSSSGSGSHSSGSQTSASNIIQPKDPYGTIGFKPLTGIGGFPLADIMGLAGQTPVSTAGTAYAAKIASAAQAASVAAGEPAQTAAPSLYSSAHAAEASSASYTPSPSFRPSADITPSESFTPSADMTPAESYAPTGLDPRHAAPPATSTWWEAGQGLRPGFSVQPEVKDLLNIRPLDLGGGEQ